MHVEPSPLAGKEVKIIAGVLAGLAYRVEDWWDRVAGRSWMDCDGNAACLDYAWRDRHPFDDEVLYGKIEGGLGKLVHVSHIEAPAE